MQKVIFKAKFYCASKQQEKLPQESADPDVKKEEWKIKLIKSVN